MKWIESLYMVAMNKEHLIKFMYLAGFDWICDIDYCNEVELIESKCNDSDDVWWRLVETEGSGFTQLFKGSIRRIFKR